MTILQRLQWTNHLLFGALAMQLLICRHAWMETTAVFPRIVLLDLPLYSPMSFGFLMLILVLCWSLRKPAFTLFFIFLLSLYCLADLNRCQEWMYFYCWMWLFASLPGLSPSNRLVLLRWTLALVYLWSGLQKWNIYYFEDTFPWLWQPLWEWPAGKGRQAGAIFSILFEVGIGIGLFWSKTRKWGVYAGWLMHFAILFALVALHRFNPVVWPWNLAMMGLLGILGLESQAKKKSGFYINRKGSKGSSRFPFAFWLWLFYASLPLLNWMGQWPDNWSYKLYAGDKAEMLFYYPAGESPCLKPAPELLDSVSILQGDIRYLQMNDWAMAAQSMPPFQDVFAYRKMGRSLCRCMEQTDRAGIAYIDPGKWDKAQDALIRESCKSLRPR